MRLTHHIAALETESLYYYCNELSMNGASPVVSTRRGTILTIVMNKNIRLHGAPSLLGLRDR